MPNLINIDLDYKATVGSRIPSMAKGERVVYTRTPKAGSLRRISLHEDIAGEFTTQEFFPEETFEITFLESARHAVHRLTRPIPVEIRCIGGEYYAKFPPIDIFAVGKDFSQAIRDFGILLGDYYDSLISREESLAVNLRGDLEILRQILD